MPIALTKAASAARRRSERPITVASPTPDRMPVTLAAPSTAGARADPSAVPKTLSSALLP